MAYLIVAAFIYWLFKDSGGSGRYWSGTRGFKRK
jgi:hypothetical protein